MVYCIIYIYIHMYVYILLMCIQKRTETQTRTHTHRHSSGNRMFPNRSVPRNTSGYHYGRASQRLTICSQSRSSLKKRHMTTAWLFLSSEILVCIYIYMYTDYDVYINTIMIRWYLPQRTTTWFSVICNLRSTFPMRLLSGSTLLQQVPCLTGKKYFIFLPVVLSNRFGHCFKNVCIRVRSALFLACRETWPTPSGSKFSGCHTVHMQDEFGRRWWNTELKARCWFEAGEITTLTQSKWLNRKVPIYRHLLLFTAGCVAMPILPLHIIRETHSALLSGPSAHQILQVLDRRLRGRKRRRPEIGSNLVFFWG